MVPKSHSYVRYMMRQKFRRGKPPIMITEKGDQRPKRPKVKKKKKEQAPTPQPVQQDVLLCPLCMKPMTDGNTHEILVNNLKVRVHKTCPT